MSFTVAQTHFGGQRPPGAGVSQDPQPYDKVITKDAKFDELVAKQKRQNLLNQTMHGYRIQIYFGGVRQKASEVKMDFNSRFPDITAYISYQQPNFKVRIGDYRNRFEAQKFLKDLEGLYPTSFIVPDDVRLPPIK